MALKTPLDAIQEFGQEALSLTPVIILGSGASAAHGVPGMWPLAQHLKALPTVSDWLPFEISEWDRFCRSLNAGVDLETALGTVRLTERQTAHVAHGTREFLLPADEAAFAQILERRDYLPLTRLYKYLFSSTHRTLDVITPNYDRLAEYAADCGDFSHFTGFTNGYLQTRARDRGGPGKGSDVTRTVCIWKVHGSLDWFHNVQGQIIGARAIRETPSTYNPLMITPGIDKYRIAHMEPFRTIFTCSDTALAKARSYLCVGYGFNDEHLQTKLIERCDMYSTPIIVITKELTPTTKAFLTSGRCHRYLALEEGPAGIRAYTQLAPEGIDMSAGPIWQLGKFLDFTIGGGA